jgi:ABC-type sugar transport system substrate-binding protein
MKTTTICLLVPVFLAALSCSGGKKTETAPAAARTSESRADKNLTVGLALNTLSTNASFIDAHKQILERFAARGDTLIGVDTKGDPNILSSSIENFISANCDVIIVSVNSIDQITGYLPAFKEKNILFGSYDTVIEEAAYNLLSNNYELGKIIGREGGKWMKEHFGGKGEAAVCSADGHEEIKKRGDGIVDGFMEICPEGKIVQRYGSAYIPTQGITAGENLLQSNPNVKVVMGINDGGILGIYEAFKAAGLAEPGNNVGLFGCDGSIDGLNAVRENNIYRATVSLSIAREIADFVDRCAEAARTGKIDPAMKVRYFPMTPIYFNNIGDA